jgi:hypothetical protein
MDPSAVFLESVRRDLSEVTPDLLSDESIVQQLERAEQVIAPWALDADDELLKKCTVALASYFSYVVYTSLAERAHGSVPTTSVIRIKELKHIAYLLLRQIMPINSDLSIDETVTFTGAGFGSSMRESILW